MRRRRHQQDGRSAELERDRDRAAELAAAQEREQIAQEVHAELAAALGDIVLEAERAEQPAIRSTAVNALNELRRLHTFDGDVSPGLDELADLVEHARDAGLPVTLHVEGEPRSVPMSVERSAYRVVEEALANIQQHAPGAPASVRVIWREHLLGLQIRDTGTAQPVELNPAGVGLVEMRERVRLHGGELRTRSVPGGGFEVMARLPL